MKRDFYYCGEGYVKLGKLNIEGFIIKLEYLNFKSLLLNKIFKEWMIE